MFWLPLVVLFSISVLGLGMSIEGHGKEKTRKENFWSTLFTFVLWWGLVYLAFAI